MYNPFSLERKTIFVTGASSGIGKAIAIECSKMGANMIISGRNTERLNDTFGKLEGNGHMQIAADLGDDESVSSLIDKLPALDGIVHCAGLIKTLPFQFCNSKQLEEIMTVNFTTPSLMSAQLVKKKKIASGGSIVFIGSISGVLISTFANSMYAASKGAVNGMVKGMALDLAPKGIRVNSINPGMIETSIMGEGVISAEQLEEDKKNYPLGKRYGKPEEVAYAVIYLLSDAASWVTGSTLLIDGGYTLQ